MGRLDPEQLGEWLSAYLDGELDGVESQRVEAILEENGEARRMLDDLRRTSQLVSTLPRHQAPPSILEEIQLHAERTQLLDGAAARPARRAGGRGWALGIVSSAAAVALFVAGGWYLGWGGGVMPPKGADELALAPAPLEDAGRVRTSVAAKSVERPAPRSNGAAARNGTASVTHTFAETDKAAGGRTAGTESALLAAATIDQKLRAGLGVPAVQSHAFGNEPVRLEIAVADAAERDRLTERVAKYLSDRRVADLSKTGDRGRDSGDAPGRFYLAGAPKRNFDDPDQRQILVRATRGELEGLMEQVALATGRDDSVALVSGPLEIRGLSRAQTMLYGLTDSTPPGETRERALGAPATTAGTAPTATSTDASPAVAPPIPAGPDQFLDQMAKMLGLDPDALAKAGEKSDAVASAAKSPPAAPTLKVELDSGDAGHADAAGKGPADTETATADTRVAAETTAPGAMERKRLDDRLSLVERREKALVQDKARRSAGVPVPPVSREAAAPAGVVGSATGARRIESGERSTTEPVVTLVVRITLPEARRVAPPADAKAARPPAKDGAAKPPDNPRE